MKCDETVSAQEKEFGGKSGKSFVKAPIKKVLPSEYLEAAGVRLSHSKCRYRVEQILKEARASARRFDQKCLCSFPPLSRQKPINTTKKYIFVPLSTLPLTLPIHARKCFVNDYELNYGDFVSYHISFPISDMWSERALYNLRRRKGYFERISKYARGYLCKWFPVSSMYKGVCMNVHTCPCVRFMHITCLQVAVQFPNMSTLIYASNIFVRAYFAGSGIFLPHGQFFIVVLEVLIPA